MPIIYCETNRKTKDVFELIRSTYVGLGADSEFIEEYREPMNDRLKAAIVNVGFACRTLTDKQARNGAVAIISDQDGADQSFGGEHDILYSLLCPSNSHEARKHLALYAEYLKFLDRIRELRAMRDIKILLCPQGKLITWSGYVCD